MLQRTASSLTAAFAVALSVASSAAQAAPPAQEVVLEVPERPARLVLICPEDAPQAELARTLAALRSELADLPATVTAVCNGPGGILAERIDHAAQTALDIGGLAAIWLEREDGKLILNFVDPEERSVRSRTIESTDDTESAALDALAVITRSTLDALMRARAGRRPTASVPAESSPPSVPPAPDAAVPPAPVPPARARLRVLLGYTGSRYAPGHIWQSGLTLAASYLWPNGVYAGVAYLVTSPISLDPFPLAGRDFVAGKIRRRPATLVGGYQRLWPVSQRALKIGLEAEFGASVDVMVARTPVRCLDEAGDECPPTHTLDTADPVRFNLGFAPRLRFLFEPTPALLLYVGGGFDLFGDQTIYANCADKSCSGILFDPFYFRPLAQVGIIARI